MVLAMANSLSLATALHTHRHHPDAGFSMLFEYAQNLTFLR
jgi:hypothetical protein